MIIDSFIFFNELDILEGRLRYLNEVVDRFVIVELNVTHKGEKKDFNLLNNIERYSKWKDKIVYLPVNFEFEKINSAWQIENTHRNLIVNALRNFDANDLVILSDVDEIPAKDAIHKASKVIVETEGVFSFQQRLLYYGMNFTVNHLMWRGSVIGKNKFFLEKGTQFFRFQRDNLPSIEEGGWHLSNWMSPEKVSFKLKNFAHQEFNTEYHTDVNRLKDRMKNGESIFSIDQQIYDRYDSSFLPKDFVEVFSDYCS